MQTTPLFERPLRLASGRYTGTGERAFPPYDRPLFLELRVDLTPVPGFEDRRVLKTISGDLFNRNQYLVTFRLAVPNFTLDSTTTQTTIEGDADLIVIDRLSGERVTDTLPIIYDYGKDICTISGIQYPLTFISPHFRFLNIELDYASALLNQTETIRVASEIIRKYFIKAGFDCRVNDFLTEPSPITENPLGGWTTRQLNQVQARNFKAHGSDIEWPKWSMYGLLVSRFERSGVAGIIYDTTDTVQRQGFAVFVDEIRRILGDPLRRGTNAYRIFEHTLIHEAGHVLNLSHSFLPRKGRSNALSWMNYPQNYRDFSRGVSGSRDFWRLFDEVKDFDLEELMVIRHGPLNWIIPGGLDWAGFGVTLKVEKHSLPVDKAPFVGCSDGDEKGEGRIEHELSVSDAYGIEEKQVVNEGENGANGST